MPTNQRLLSTGEVVRILGCTRQHVRNLCDRGDLEHVKHGTYRRIRPASLTTYLTELETSTPPSKLPPSETELRSSTCIPAPNLAN